MGSISSRGTRMLLAIDVGNTNAVFGLYAADEPEPVAIWRLTSRRDRTDDEWFALLAPLFEAAYLKPSDVDGVVLSSVVPVIGDALSHASRARFKTDPLLVSSTLDLGIAVRTDAPSETGTD